MGRMLKNTVFKTGSYALGVPVGSSTIGPDAPTVGQARWNTTTSKMEFYNGSAWQSFAKEGSTTVVKDTFTGDNTNSAFGPMSYSYSASQEPQVLVFLNTVFQNPGVNYTFNGTTNITFTSTPPLNAAIIVLHNLPSTTIA